MNDQKFSEEFLNAFVDNQIGPEEKERVYLELNRDESLNRQVCELRKLRDLVQTAYRPIEPPSRRLEGKARRHRSTWAVAAGLASLLGLSAGWLIHGQPARDPSPTTIVARQPAPSAAEGELKVVIHLADSGPSHVRHALDELEGLLQHYRQTHQLVRVEVIANGDGLDMLRSDTSPEPERIARLQREYDNVSFVACQNTIDRLRWDKGVAVALLPGVVVIDSGVAQLMRRQQQGWAYIQG